MSTRDLVDFVAMPVETGWYGVICLAGAGATLKLAVYFGDGQWRDVPMFPWFRSKECFETAQKAQAWLDNQPD